MLSRNDQPNINAFNFGADSVFNNYGVTQAEIIPVIPNEFLLLDTENLNLLDGTMFLLLGN